MPLTMSTARLALGFFRSSIRRSIHTKIHHNQQPPVEALYNQLVRQSASTTPIACNFVSQVIDVWAHNKTQLALRCLDLDKGTQEDITYTQLVKGSHQIANFIAQQGINKGDAVALMLGQHPAWWFSLAGMMRAGIAAVPCSRLHMANDLSYRFNDLGIKGIITTPELQHRVDAIQHECPTLTMLATTGTGNRNWHSLIDIFNSNFGPAPAVTTTTADPCVYLYTSGTTGQPKAVQHNTDYPFFHWPTGQRWLGATPEDLIFNASDTGWGFTVWITTAAWATGAKLLITPNNHKFNPQQMLQILCEQPVTIFAAAPTVLRLLAAQPNFSSLRFASLKRIVTVGEALDEVVINAFAKHGVEIAVGFGQAETPLIMGRVDNQPHVAGTMGKAIDPYKIVILDDDFKPLPKGEIGQIAVDLVEGSSAGIMRSYANAPEKTIKSRSPDRRYHLTGDWAEFRHDGAYIYQGRKDDLIKSRGYRIGPDEIEKVGMLHPAVAKIAVVGIRTTADSAAITVKAFILLKPSYTETPELIKSIQDHIKIETGPYKYPRLIECLSPEEWEKYETTSGKIRRAGLREREENKLKEVQASAIPSFRL